MFDKTNEKTLKPKKQLEKYNDIVSSQTILYSKINPDVIEEFLANDLKKQNIELKSSDTKYKYKFTMISTSKELGEVKNEICVRLLEASESLVSIDIKKISGDQFKYLECYNLLKKRMESIIT